MLGCLLCCELQLRQLQAGYRLYQSHGAAVCTAQDGEGREDRRLVGTSLGG